MLKSRQKVNLESDLKKNRYKFEKEVNEIYKNLNQIHL
jgi:hypothetical protein